jgi:hypothetical protein
MQCLRLRFTETKIKLKNDTLSLMHTGPFTTRAPKKNRKHEIAFGCVILMKKTECVVKTHDRSETFVLQGNIVIILQSLLNSIFTTKLYILMKKINYKQR